MQLKTWLMLTNTVIPCLRYCMYKNCTISVSYCSMQTTVHFLRVVVHVAICTVCRVQGVTDITVLSMNLLSSKCCSNI